MRNIDDQPYFRDQLPIFVVADLHGQFCDLRAIFSKCGHPYRQNYLFLGDYADRGTQGVEIITLLASLKLKYPNRIFMIRFVVKIMEFELKMKEFQSCSFLSWVNSMKQHIFHRKENT